MLRLLRAIMMIWFIFGLLIMLVIYWGQQADSPVLSFIAVRDDVTDIFLYDIRTGLDYNLTNNIQQESSLSWSRNPVSLGYLSTIQLGKVDDNYHIMSRLGHSNTIDITEYGSALGTSLSPDSQYIAHFASFPRHSDIHLTDLSRRVTYNLTQTPEQSEFTPRWSPDNHYLLYLLDGNLYLFDRQTEQTRLFLDYELKIDDMFWSPDSQKITFYTDVWQDGRYVYQLHTITIDGANIQTYPLESEPRTEPLSWSPDSCCIILGLTSGELAMIEFEPYQIRYFAGEERRFAPVWSPNGRWVAFIENRRIHLLDLHTMRAESIDKSWRINIPMLWKP